MNQEKIERNIDDIREKIEVNNKKCAELRKEIEIFSKKITQYYYDIEDTIQIVHNILKRGGQEDHEDHLETIKEYIKTRDELLNTRKELYKRLERLENQRKNMQTYLLQLMSLLENPELTERAIDKYLSSINLAKQIDDLEIVKEKALMGGRLKRKRIQSLKKKPREIDRAKEIIGSYLDYKISEDSNELGEAYFYDEIECSVKDVKEAFELLDKHYNYFKGD